MEKKKGLENTHTHVQTSHVTEPMCCHIHTTKTELRAKLIQNNSINEVLNKINLKNM